MLGIYEVIVEMLSVVIALGIVGLCLRYGWFTRYLSLNSWLLAVVVFTSGCYYVRTVYGYTSPEYFYFYYTGDAVATIALYLLIGSFFDRLLRESVFHKYVRPTLAFFFLMVVGVSGLFVSRSMDNLYSRFGIELQQNMFFVGLLLTFLLWISMSYLRAESRRFVLLVSGLGIYFSAHAVSYALQFLFSGLKEIWLLVPPLAYTLMVSLWLYTFLRVPEGEPAAEPVARSRPQRVLQEVRVSHK